VQIKRVYKIFIIPTLSKKNSHLHLKEIRERECWFKSLQLNNFLKCILMVSCVDIWFVLPNLDNYFIKKLIPCLTLIWSRVDIVYLK